MKPMVAVLVGLLACSAAANAVLWRRSAATKRQDTVAARTPSAATPPTRHAGDHVAAPAPPPGTAPAMLVSPDAACPIQLAELQERLHAAEAQLAQHLPPNEKFDRGQPNPEANQAIGPEVERVLAGAGGAVPQHELDCRGSVCRLTILATRDMDANTWGNALQSDEVLRRKVHGMMFTAGAPTSDPITKEALMENQIYLGLAEGDEGAGMDFLNRWWHDFRRSPAVRDCAARGGSGTLELRLHLTAAHTIETRVGGELGATPLGACVTDALLAAATSTTVPAVAGAMVFVSLSFPL